MSPTVTKALLEGRGEDTERNRVLDIARGAPWPDRYTARTLRTGFLDRWRDHEQALLTDTSAQAEFRVAAARGDPDAAVSWASDALDLITDLTPAAHLVTTLAAAAEGALHQALG